MSTAFVATLNRDNGKIVLSPSTIVDQEIADAVKAGEVMIEITRARSLKFHKKYFVLLKVIFDMMDEHTREEYGIMSSEVLRNRIKIDLGLYDLWISHEGIPMYIPKSMSFGSMDGERFERLYKDTINVAIGKYTKAQTEDSMMRMVDAILRFE